MASGTAVLARPPATLSMSEIQSLCRRLEARAQSPIFLDRPEARGDMLLAELALRAFTRSHHHSDRITLTTAAA